MFCDSAKRNWSKKTLSCVSYSPEIRSLTSLRFFAAMWVLVFHLNSYSDAPLGGPAAKGYLGVDFFFILSGWILTHVYMEAFSSGVFSYSSFLVARIARIYPLHVFFVFINVALFGVLAVSGLAPREVDWGQLPIVLGLMHAWGLLGSLDWNDPSWSLSAEWFAYLAFPILLFGSLRLSPYTLIVTAIGTLILFFAVAEVTIGSLTSLTYDFGVIRVIPEFFLGIAVYRFGRVYALPALPLSGLLLGCVLLILGAPSAHDLILILALAASIYTIAEWERRGVSILGFALVHYLGKISYSIYLAHFIVFYAYFGLLKVAGNIDVGAAPAWSIPPVVFLVLLTATIGYHLVEKPFRARIRNWVIPQQGVTASKRGSCV